MGIFTWLGRGWEGICCWPLPPLLGGPDDEDAAAVEEDGGGPAAARVAAFTEGEVEETGGVAVDEGGRVAREDDRGAEIDIAAGTVPVVLLVLLLVAEEEGGCCDDDCCC